MAKLYDSSLQSSLHEIKNDAKRKNSLKSLMQVIFVLSFLILVMLAFAKAQGI